MRAQPLEPLAGMIVNRTEHASASPGSSGSVGYVYAFRWTAAPTSLARKMCPISTLERKTAAIIGCFDNSPIKNGMFSTRCARAGLASTSDPEYLGGDVSSQLQSRSCRAAVQSPSGCARPIALDDRLPPEAR